MSILSRWTHKRRLRSAFRRIGRNEEKLKSLDTQDIMRLVRSRPDLTAREAVGIEDLTDEEHAACQEWLRGRGRHAEAAMLGRVRELEHEAERTRMPTEEDVEECLALSTAFINRLKGSR